MAWSSTYIGKAKAGDKWVAWGTWDATSATGGDIDTKLRVVDVCLITHTGTAAEAATGVLNETFPGVTGNGPTVVCTSGDAGEWFAIGIE